jgi:2-keto-4-pentenoate hydratase/2-oxohepta-3-ene-1,7-dioic acid hydratase in catechol pathway
MTPQPFQLGTFSIAGCTPFPGLVIDERVIALQALQSAPAKAGAQLTRCATLLDVLDDWDHNFQALSGFVQALTHGELSEWQRQLRPVAELHVHAPLPRPPGIYCSGANYKKHVIDLIVAHQEQTETQGLTPEQKREWGMRLMDERAAKGTPFIFMKPQSAVIGPFDTLVVPRGAMRPDWELELGVVIGRRAYRVSRDDALAYVAGYTIVNDITLREKVFRRKTDSPELGMDFVLSKGAPGFLPMGPYLVPAAFVGDPQKLRVTLRLNGQTMQDEETSDMIFSVARLIEYLSSGVELQPGDVICTGSPAGNGMHYGRFIQEGDLLEGSVTGPLSGLGTQRNPCILERH